MRNSGKNTTKLTDQILTLSAGEQTTVYRSLQGQVFFIELWRPILPTAMEIQEKWQLTMTMISKSKIKFKWILYVLSSSQKLKQENFIFDYDPDFKVIWRSNDFFEQFYITVWRLKTRQTEWDWMILFLAFHMASE